MARRTSSQSVLGSVRGDSRGWVLLSLAFGWFIVLGLRFLVPAILPQIEAEFHVSDGTAGVAVTVIWACYAISQFPAGLLVDRLGERTLLTTSLVFTALALVVFALSPVFTAFLFGCAVFGLATGLYGPARGMALSHVFKEGRSVAFGVTLAAGSIGSASVPVLASLLVGHVDWHVTVAAIVPVALVIGVGLWRAVPESEITDRGSVQESSLARTVVATVNNRRVLVAGIAVMFMLFSYQGLTAFLPTYLTESKGLSQSTASALFAVLFISGAGFQLLSGRATDAYNSKIVLLAIAAVGAVTLVALPYTTGLVPLLVLIVVLSSRLGMSPVSNSYIIASIPNEVQGTAWGFVRMCFFLVGSTGSTFVGAMADRGRFDTAFLVLGGVTAVAFVIYLFLPNK